MTAGEENGADRQPGASGNPEPKDGTGHARAGKGGFGNGLRAALAGLGLGRGETPKVGKGEAYDIGSESFRKACALLPDGRVFVVRAYNDGPLAAEEAELRARYDLPPATKRKVATLAEIAAFHGEAVQEAVSSTPTAGQLRLQANLRDAEMLQASDIKLKEYPTHGVMRFICGAGEFTHGDQWKPDEVKQAVHWAHNVRDGGGGEATLVTGVHSQFSIGQGGMPEGMPDGIGTFRGQIAWQGNQQRLLNLRLLPKPDPSTYGDVAGLGHEEDVLEALAEERRTETGLVIVGGSTGDGKSTTLVRNLQRLYLERDRGISILTLEDPIEYLIPGDGISQVAVAPGKTPEERSANWVQALMLFVRLNPRVGMVSEIRSAADVNEVLHFVSSGHKVYTSVHADSANGVLFRLVSLGVLPTELSGPKMVNLVLNQKVVPKLCDGCAEPLSGPALARVEEWLGQDPLGTSFPQTRPRRRTAAGCEVCRAPFASFTGALRKTATAAWAGYLGRKATAEFIRVDNDYRRLLEKRDALGAQEHWLTPSKDGGMGGIPLETRLRRLVADGVADFQLVTNERLPAPLRAITGPGAQQDEAGTES